MKKILTIIISLLICISACSCAKGNENYNQAALKYEDNKFSYNLKNVCAFTVNEKILYAAFNGEPYIYQYDEDGKEIGKLDFGEGFHTNLSYYDNKLFSFTYGENRPYITVYDLNTNECAANAVNDVDITSAIGMTVLQDKIYLIYWSENHDEYQESIKYSDDDSYIYMGEKAVCIDTDSYEAEEIDIKNVLNLKPYSENEVLYYAYDDIGGYYFTVYDVLAKSFSDKIYNNNPLYTLSFAYNSDDESIIYSDFSNRKLTSVSLEQSDTKIDFMSNVVSVTGNELQFYDGECYILDNPTGNIFRAEYSKSVKKNKEIMFCSSEIYSEVPYGCGYSINSFMLNDDEFALSILAGNSDYDICMMASQQTFSQNIRDKGAFYPLNDVPMVKEYLDACFPYLKEAAADNNGRIWMIPIAADIPCILYNPENCQKYNINFDENTTWQYLFDIADNLYGSENLRSKFQLNGYQAESDIIHRYISNYAVNNNKSDFDNQLFRDTCQMIKNNDMASESLHTRLTQLSRYPSLTDYFNDYIFELTPYQYSMFYDEAFNTLRAAATPPLKENEPNCAECTYFCVNSNSDNLSAALDFISSYCSYMLEQNDSYMFRDKNIYQYGETPLAQDLYNIYSNAKVSFTIPKEMFWDDYLKYRNGQISLDDFITEAERKVDMYINE